MRPRVLRRRLALAAFGAVLAGALIGTGVAKADSDTDYLQALNNSGLSVYNAAEAIATGAEICNMLQSADGNAVAFYVYTHTTWADVPNLTVAEVMVLDAVGALCPWENHASTGRELT
jgi:hypothetical protein